MHMSKHPTEPKRTEIDAMRGPLLLEFGTAWCGHCMRAQPLIAQALAQQPEITHLKVEDGQGRPLGRSFGVKLWPTLIFLKDGQEIARLIRPQNAGMILEKLQQLTG